MEGGAYLMYVTRKRWTGAEYSLFAIAFFAVSIILVYTFNFPRALLYFGDIINIFVLLMAIRARAARGMRVSKTEALIFLLFVSMICSSLVNLENPFLVVWGLRNNTRMFICYINCATFLTMEEYKKLFSFLEKLFWLSLPLCIIERFFVSYPFGTIVGDMIGGFFWNYSGCNAPLNLLLCLTTCYVTIKYFKGKKSLVYFISVICAALVMSALAELKVFIPEMAIIFAAILLTLRVDFKSMLRILLCVLLISIVFSAFVGLFVFLNDNGQNYADNFTIQGLLAYASRDSGYDGTGDLNRLSGISRVINEIFKGDLSLILLGTGVGNAEYTNFFVSEFYQKYSALHYQYFQHIWLFIETGLAGVALYWSVIIRAFLNVKRQYVDEDDFCFIKTVAILALFFFFYNTTLRGETTGPLIFMLLAMPEVAKKNFLYEQQNK